MMEKEIRPIENTLLPRISGFFSRNLEGMIWVAFLFTCFYFLTNNRNLSIGIADPKMSRTPSEDNVYVKVMDIGGCRCLVTIFRSKWNDDIDIERLDKNCIPKSVNK
jgi:hypothetical protein